MSELSPTTKPFRLNGLDGQVTIEYGVNDDPIRWGYGLLGPDHPPEMARGFPVVQASVSYTGEGYAADMGWIQLVRYRVDDAREDILVFDVSPQLQDTDMPYLAFGARPTLFDAPGFTEREVTWDADSFLVHTPDAVLSRVIHAIGGFKWGYRIRGGDVRPIQLVLATEDDWHRNLPDLRRRYPTWTFGSSWSD